MTQLESASEPTYKLHSASSVLWAGFWGTPIAAGIVMAINYSRIGEKQKARNAVVFSTLATIALLVVLFLVPEKVMENIPSAAFLIPQMFLIYKAAKYYQEDILHEHQMNGGKNTSAWAGVGIGILSLFVVLIVIFTVAFLLEPALGELYKVGNDELYYRGDATQEDAEKLAVAMHRIGYFGGEGIAVVLEKHPDKQILSFFVNDGAWDHPDVVADFERTGQLLKQLGIDTPLEIRLCNDYFENQSSIMIE